MPNRTDDIRIRRIRVVLRLGLVQYPPDKAVGQIASSYHNHCSDTGVFFADGSKGRKKILIKFYVERYSAILVTSSYDDGNALGYLNAYERIVRAHPVGPDGCRC